MIKFSVFCGAGIKCMLTMMIVFDKIEDITIREKVYKATIEI